jgi:hypothetical protein
MVLESYMNSKRVKTTQKRLNQTQGVDLWLSSVPKSQIYYYYIHQIILLSLQDLQGQEWWLPEHCVHAPPSSTVWKNMTLKAVNIIRYTKGALVTFLCLMDTRHTVPKWARQGVQGSGELTQMQYITA